MRRREKELSLFLEKLLIVTSWILAEREIQNGHMVILYLVVQPQKWDA
jgi:hypothetical protein